MRRALVACLGLVAITLALHSSVWAEEKELAGVSLGSNAISLLSRTGFGQPDFIGPLGAGGAQQSSGARAGGGPAGRGGVGAPGQGGPRGRPGRMGGPGSREGMMRRGAAPSFTVALTQGRGGREGRMGGPRGQPGGMGGPGGRGGRNARGRATSAGNAATPQNLYWLYRRPGKTQLVLTLNLRGLVTAITLNGSLPYPPGYTSKGIGLSDSYIEVVNRYSYPEKVVTQGTSLELTYVNHGVRFRLDAMRVSQITIGAYVPKSLPQTPAVAPKPTAPAAGMSIPELKGYM